MAAESDSEAARKQAIEDAATSLEGATDPFTLSHRNFDPTQMESVTMIRIDGQNGEKEYAEKVAQGYECYGVYVVREARGIYMFSHRTVALMCKPKNG